MLNAAWYAECFQYTILIYFLNFLTLCAQYGSIWPQEKWQKSCSIFLCVSVLSVKNAPFDMGQRSIAGIIGGYIKPSNKIEFLKSITISKNSFSMPPWTQISELAFLWNIDKWNKSPKINGWMFVPIDQIYSSTYSKFLRLCDPSFPGPNN